MRQRVRAALEARERRRLEEGTAPAARGTPTRAAMALMQTVDDGPDGPQPQTGPAGDDAGP